MMAYEDDLIKIWNATSFDLGPNFVTLVTSDQLAFRMAEERLRSMDATKDETEKLFPNSDDFDYQRFLSSKVSTETCRNPAYWESLKCKMFSKRSSDHDKSLVALLNMSLNSEFLLINAPPDLLELLLSSVGIFDSCNRRLACEEQFRESSIANLYRLFFDGTVNPVIVRHFICSCVDVILLWAMKFDAHEEQCRIIIGQMASDDDVDVKVSIEFLNQMEKHGIGAEDITSKKRVKFSPKELVLFSHVGKKFEVILAILKNLSANRYNRVIIAQQKHVWRFCVLMLHCSWKNLRLLAFDLLSSIADFMYLKAPLEEFALAGLLLVVKNGLKSLQTFVIQKSVQTIRKWSWCFTPWQESSRPNISMMMPFLDLPTLIIRLGTVLFAPERETVIDSLLILIILMQTKSNETELARTLIKSSTELLHAAALLIFTRVRTHSKPGQIILGLDSYIGSIIGRLNKTISTEINQMQLQKLRVYRQIFIDLYKEVAANPRHRMSFTELTMCGWAMRTYRALRPPPLIVKRVIEESVRNENFRNKIYLSKPPTVPEKVTNTCTCRGFSDPVTDKSGDDLHDKPTETPLSVIGRLVYDSVAIETGYFCSPLQNPDSNNNDKDGPPSKKFKCINDSCKRNCQPSSSQPQSSRQFVSYALSNYAYPRYKQISDQGRIYRMFNEFPKSYFPGSGFFPAYRTVKYKRTLWNRILRIRARSCGKRLGVSLSLPFCKSKRPAGPVCVTIVKLTCALLKLIVDESPLARRYIRGMEPQLAFLISCDEDYSKCTMYLSALFESLR